MLTHCLKNAMLVFTVLPLIAGSYPAFCFLGMRRQPNPQTSF